MENFSSIWPMSWEEGQPHRLTRCFLPVFWFSRIPFSRIDGPIRVRVYGMRAIERPFRQRMPSHPGIRRSVICRWSRSRRIRFFHHVVGNHLVGCDTILDPFLKRRNPVHFPTANTIAAMVHSRWEEKTHEVHGLVRSTHQSRDHLVVFNARVGPTASIIPSVVHDQLATGRLELAKIWVAMIVEESEVVPLVWTV